MMSRHNEQISLLFYDFLCGVIGTEEVVQTRRSIFHALDCVGVRNKHVVSSGSKSEGLDFADSDLDIMYLLKKFKVYENEPKVVDIDEDTVELIMDDVDTKAGFTRLQLLPGSLIPAKYSDIFIEFEDNKLYLSSKEFLQKWSSDSKGSMVIHGPCVSTPSGDADFAMCLYCKDWVKQALGWIDRSRSNWPTSTLVHSIIQHGVCFVPIGSKGSKYEHLEFRLSFSVAEKMLIHSFNHVQLCCYALLKIVLKDILRKRHGEILCSYFMKTIMLWLCEETEQSDWKPGQLLPCFMGCFKRLIYCVKNKTCVHYFIPSNDFFEGRFLNRQHNEVLLTLQNLYAMDWKMLLQTTTLQSFSTCVPSYGLSVLPTLFILVSSVTFLFDENDFGHKSKHSLRIQNKDARCLSMHLVNKVMAQASNLSNRDSNKTFYTHYKTCSCHLLMGTQLDAVSGWLLLASLFYQSRQYKICLIIIEYCLKQSTPNKILMSYIKDISSHSVFNENLKMVKKYKKHHSLTWTCKSNTLIMTYIVQNSYLFPQELSDGEELMELPPVLYAFFLKFACAHNLGELEDKYASLLHLTKTFSKFYFVPLEVISSVKAVWKAAIKLVNAERIL